LQTLWPLLIAALVLWLVFRFVRSQFQSREPSETVGGAGGHDPFSGVPSPKKRGPQSRSGAVALAEPDDDEEEYKSYPLGRVDHFSVARCSVVDLISP
jgi:hypothetical protein